MRKSMIVIDLEVTRVSLRGAFCLGKCKGDGRAGVNGESTDVRGQMKFISGISMSDICQTTAPAT